MEFRTPWSSGPRARAGRGPALGAVPGLARRRPPPGGRRSSRSSAPWSTCPTGEQVRLAGYADRLELDADGRVVVVDLKTGRNKPTDKSLATNLQLGLYQLRRRPRCRRRPGGPGRPEGPVRAGGAELVQLGLTDGGPAATVQAQGVQADEGPERADLRRQLARAASPAPHRALPGGRRPAVPRLPVRAALPGPERRARGDAMSGTLGPRRRLASPEELAEAMGVDVGRQPPAVGGDHAPRWSRPS